MFEKIQIAMKQPFLLMIRAYQHTLSPDHGLLSRIFPYGYCKFHPTCSQYGYEAIQKHGLLRGLFLTFRRVIRCHPFNSGGFDPIP